jgi:aminocarboxymuconate-semialdehyde decarboxylase
MLMDRRREPALGTNELLAEVAFKQLSRCRAAATFPGLNASGAIAEIGYALDTLKMDRAVPTTSINDAYLGSATSWTGAGPTFVYRMIVK